MTKTSRTHCVHPVKTYYTKVLCISESVKLKDYEARQKKKKDSYHAKVTTKLCLLSVNST